MFEDNLSSEKSFTIFVYRGKQQHTEDCDKYLNTVPVEIIHF